MLRMVLSVCGLVGLLAVQPLFAQSAQSRTDSKPAKPDVRPKVFPAQRAPQSGDYELSN